MMGADRKEERKQDRVKREWAVWERYQIGILDEAFEIAKKNLAAIIRDGVGTWNCTIWNEAMSGSQEWRPLRFLNGYLRLDIPERWRTPRVLQRGSINVLEFRERPRGGAVYIAEIENSSRAGGRGTVLTADPHDWVFVPIDITPLTDTRYRVKIIHSLLIGDFEFVIAIALAWNLLYAIDGVDKGYEWLSGLMQREIPTRDGLRTIAKYLTERNAWHDEEGTHGLIPIDGGSSAMIPECGGYGPQGDTTPAIAHAIRKWMDCDNWAIAADFANISPKTITNNRNLELTLEKEFCDEERNKVIKRISGTRKAKYLGKFGKM